MSAKKAKARRKIKRAYLLAVYNNISPVYSIPATMRMPMFLPTKGGGRPIKADKMKAITRAGNLF